MLMPIMPQSAFGGGYDAELVYSSDTADVDLFAAAGSPVAAVHILVTVNSGVDVYGSHKDTPGMDGTGLPVGSVVDLILEGRICGERGTPNSGYGGDALKLGCETNVSGGGSINGGGGAGGVGHTIATPIYDNDSQITGYSYDYGGAGGYGEKHDAAATAGGTRAGAGGAFGNAGAAGTGGAGGAPGKAIDVNGFPYTNTCTANGAVS